jgi:hypothetical protein
MSAMKMIAQRDKLKTAVYIHCIGCPDSQSIPKASLLRGMRLSDVGTPSKYRVRSSSLINSEYNDALSIGVPYLEGKQTQKQLRVNTLSTHTGERVCLC